MSSHRSIAELVDAAGIDPAAGVQVVDAARLSRVPWDPGWPLLVLPAAVPPDAERLPGRHAAPSTDAPSPADAAGMLARLYPAGHPARSLDDGRHLAVEALTDADLAAGAWLLPAVDPVDNIGSPHGMAAISARLRAPDGCPWDRRQTHLTLRPFVLEEAYETVDAIERGSAADLAEELGDLFLQVVLHAQLAAEEGTFDLVDVYRALGAKIVRRHPHVFGDVEAATAEEVLRNWEAIKSSERAGAVGEGAVQPETGSAFAGVARALPALAASREIQERASSLGWDWDAVEGVWEKVREELDELHVAGAASGEEGHDARLHELGDLLFALVNLGRWMRVDPEEALRAANRRWIERYHAVEALAEERGVVLADLDLHGKDRLWDEVKARRSRA